MVDENRVMSHQTHTRHLLDEDAERRRSWYHDNKEEHNQQSSHAFLLFFPSHRTSNNTQKECRALEREWKEEDLWTFFLSCDRDYALEGVESEQK